MIAKLIADSLTVIHFGFILFVVLGGIPVLKWRKFFWFHIPCVLWGTIIELTGWICPLTPLEIYFREKAGIAGYKGGFIDHYIIPLVYPQGLTRNTQIMLGIALLVINLCIYGAVLRNKFMKNT